MILLHRLNKKAFYLNHRLIERIETNPDTTIHLMNGQSFVVRETPEEIQEKIIDFERKIFYDKIIKIVDKQS
ncbi:MAG: flagellar FlbD family protein [Leptospiraceae bacterium]|nr:flagellar FlbD family protein [Leptospiraceae bacterium]MDW7975427.1 flagellar FlbD family protein [Leptospiraceae bacterium]